MLCRTSLFSFSLCPHVTFYKTLTSLSTVFIKAHVGLLQLLKWLSHFVFYPCGALLQCGRWFGKKKKKTPAKQEESEEIYSPSTHDPGIPTFLPMSLDQHYNGWLLIAPVGEVTMTWHGHATMVIIWVSKRSLRYDSRNDRHTHHGNSSKWSRDQS